MYEDIKKELIVQEDIDFGENTVDQTRQDTQYENLAQVNNLYTINSIEELQYVDPLKFPKVVLFENGIASFYQYVENSYVKLDDFKDPVFDGTVKYATMSQLQNVYDSIVNDEIVTIILVERTVNTYPIGNLTLSAANKDVTVQSYEYYATYSEIRGDVSFNFEDAVSTRLTFRNVTLEGNFLYSDVSYNHNIQHLEMTNCYLYFGNLPSYIDFRFCDSCVLTDTYLNFWRDGTVFYSPNVYYNNCQGVELPTSAAEGSVIYVDGAYHTYSNGSWILSTVLLQNALQLEKYDFTAQTIVANLKYNKQIPDPIISIQNNSLDIQNKHLVIIELATQTIVNEFMGFFDGQEFTIISLNTNLTIQHNETIKLKNSISRIMSNYETINFIVYESKCIEV